MKNSIKGLIYGALAIGIIWAGSLTPMGQEIGQQLGITDKPEQHLIQETCTANGCTQTDLGVVSK